MSDVSNSTITITFGDVAENGVRMQKIGAKSDRGFSVADMLRFKDMYEEQKLVCELIDLNAVCGFNFEPAFMLIVRGYNSAIMDRFKQEHSQLIPDRKKKMRGRVVNSLARHNLCFGAENQLADYDSGKGTIVAFSDLPVLNSIRERLISEIGVDVKVAEGNYYYDIKKCGIGWHGDAERSWVVGMRFGQTMPFCIAWYQRSKRISEVIRVDLYEGDMYMLSEKAVGSDWMKKIVPTLRHSAGCKKYIS